MADERADEFRVAAGRGLLDLIVEDGLDLLLGAGNLVVAETEALHPFELGVEGLEAVQDVVLLQGDLAVHGVDVFISQAAESQLGVQIRAVGLGGDVGETLLHHQLDHDLDEILRRSEGGGVVNFGRGFAVPDHGDGRVGPLGIGEDAHARFVMVRDGQVRLRLRILALGDDGEDLLNLGLGAVHIDITDDDNRLHVRMIPGRVEGGEAFGLEGLQAFRRPISVQSAIFVPSK
jgi:hypothetical protein